MSKVSQECPICDSSFIVLMLDKGAQRAWPSCWKCGFDGHTKEDKEALAVDLKANPHMDNTELFDKTTGAWNEYLALLKQQKTIEKENNNVECN